MMIFIFGPIQGGRGNRVGQYNHCKHTRFDQRRPSFALFLRSTSLSCVYLHIHDIGCVVTSNHLIGAGSEKSRHFGLRNRKENGVTNSEADAVGTIEAALQQAARLLADRPEMAAEQALAILDAVPEHPQAQLYLGIAQRRSGDGAAALVTLEALAKAQPNSADTAFEFGLTLVESGRHEQALTSLSEATRLRPAFAEAWRVIGDLHELGGDHVAADTAYARQIRSSVTEPALIEAAVALGDGKLAIAETLLRDYLKERPDDAAAVRMLADVAMRLGRLGDAETLLEHCLGLAPGFTVARRSFATLLHRANKSEAALAQLEILLARDPRDPSARNMQAAVLARIGDFEGSIAHYEAVLADYPNQPKAWMSYGHALKTVARVPDSIAAYRTAIAQAPQLGEAWWSLANLKTMRFSAEDITTMEAQLARDDLDEDDRFHLDFALGKAFEDAGAYEASFTHYALGNALRRTQVDYNADDLTQNVSRAISVFTSAYFSLRTGWGSSAPDPIFVIGLPRAGSTLIEQILSSHSQIEGTTELPDIIAMARRLGGHRTANQPSLYPEMMTGLTHADCNALGDEYLETSRIQRRSDRPLFVDKMPNNFQHIGLIASILPNAKIIDARRHPMGCCFSGFKQHFARGQNFSTSQEDIGRYYCDYVRLMAHIDDVLPGRVHRVFYENMVADSEAEIRALLSYCGLEFEPACLDFHETERAVRTPSSEQVRQPIYADGVEQWRNYAPWLAPLRTTLGIVVDNYPKSPPIENREI
jgi:tetratricopeptide (TPR) repeat protein